jgi:hypothetical protein
MTPEKLLLTYLTITRKPAKYKLGKGKSVPGTVFRIIIDNFHAIVYIKSMENKKIYFPVTLAIIVVLFCLIGSCKTTPEAPAEEIEQVMERAEPEEAPYVGPMVITEEYRSATMNDVRAFIEELNRIIRTRNYSAWRTSLSQEYFNYISSNETLQMASEMPAMKTRGVVLKNAEDYFTHVVVPSRANSRVDDIEFISESRIKVFSVRTTRSGEEQRVRLYDLERTGNTWKIIN